MYYLQHVTLINPSDLCAKLYSTLARGSPHPYRTLTVVGAGWAGETRQALALTLSAAEALITLHPATR